MRNSMMEKLEKQRDKIDNAVAKVNDELAKLDKLIGILLAAADEKRVAKKPKAKKKKKRKSK